MKMPIVLVLLAAPLLAACQPAAVPPAADACGAAGYQSLTGALLAAVTLPADLDARIIQPDSAMTLEYRAERLNIRVDDAGRIIAVTCG